MSHSQPRLCAVDGCLGRHYGKGFCDFHYQRWRTHGDPGIALTSRERRPVQECSQVGCDTPRRSRAGLCRTHAKEVARRAAGARPWSEYKPVPPPRVSVPLPDRFWSRVHKGDDCWLWMGSTNNKGYGTIHDPTVGRNVYTHRVSYELNIGPIPSGLEVCHTCDNPPCVRPDHLFVGTHQENMRDMVVKGRHGNRYT